MAPKFKFLAGKKPVFPYVVHVGVGGRWGRDAVAVAWQEELFGLAAVLEDAAGLGHHLAVALLPDVLLELRGLFEVVVTVDTAAVQLKRCKM